MVDRLFAVCSGANVKKRNHPIYITVLNLKAHVAHVPTDLLEGHYRGGLKVPGGGVGEEDVTAEIVTVVPADFVCVLAFCTIIS